MKRTRTRPRGWLRSGVVALIVTTAMAMGPARALNAHPIHTTLTQITYDSASRAIVISLRVFADDFAVAVGRHSRVKPGPDHSVAPAAAYGYVQSAFSLADASGRPISLEWCGAKRSGAVVWLCLRSPSPVTPRGLRVLNKLLFEVHDDQVNLVQSATSGKNTSMLFTRGDRARALP